jgi:hypothetical protein
MPILILYQSNLEEIPLEDIFIPLILSISIVSISWFLLKSLFRSNKISLVISFMIILLILFSYTRLYFANNADIGINFLGSNIILMPIILCIGIIGIICIYKKNVSNDLLSIFNVMSVVVVLFLVIPIGYYFISDDSQIISLSDYVEIPIIPSNVVEKPDVYVLVLDAYSGDITLEQDFNYDNSEFKNELKNRGFVVQKPSYSNYPNTEFSMPSIMNMVYLDFLVSELGQDSQNKKPAIELRLRNTVMDIFNQNGYHLTSFYGGSKATPSDDSEIEILCGRGILNMNEDLQRSFIQTYFTINYLRVLLYDDFRYHDLECSINEVLQFEKKNEKPQYVHTHLFLPHQPFIYNSSGERVDHKYTDNRFDESLRDAYLEQLIFTNKITLEMIDSIQNRDANSVIILMSDHGGRLGVDWNNPTELDYYRAFNTLSAFYFPGHADEIPENIAAVNTFRVFFNTYFDTDYELLKDRQMWYSPERPYDQIDVAEQIMK